MKAWTLTAYIFNIVTSFLHTRVHMDADVECVGEILEGWNIFYVWVKMQR
jgi:hypothetical protein